MQQMRRAVEVTSGGETGKRQSRRRVLEGSGGSQFEKSGCIWGKEKVRRVRQGEINLEQSLAAAEIAQRGICKEIHSQIEEKNNTWLNRPDPHSILFSCFCIFELGTLFQPAHLSPHYSGPTEEVRLLPLFCSLFRHSHPTRLTAPPPPPPPLSSSLPCSPFVLLFV